MKGPTAPGLRLRVVTGDDWELWRDMRHRGLSQDPEAFGSTLEQEREYDEAAWRSGVNRGRMVVAFLGNRPVGMAGSHAPEPGVTAIISMWVAPEQRGQGLGRRLVDDVVAASPALDVVRLWVAEGNDGARRVYERAGFVDTGARKPVRPGASRMRRQMELAPDRRQPRPENG
jgi:ribosomal protein S18 acetylase RimI-like enzyme